MIDNEDVPLLGIHDLLLERRESPLSTRPVVIPRSAWKRVYARHCPRRQHRHTHHSIPDAPLSINGAGDDLGESVCRQLQDLLSQIEFFGGGLQDVASMESCTARMGWLRRLGVCLRDARGSIAGRSVHAFSADPQQAGHRAWYRPYPLCTAPERPPRAITCDPWAKKTAIRGLSGRRTWPSLTPTTSARWKVRPQRWNIGIETRLSGSPIVGAPSLLVNFHLPHPGRRSHEPDPGYLDAHRGSGRMSRRKPQPPAPGPPGRFTNTGIPTSTSVFPESGHWLVGWGH